MHNDWFHHYHEELWLKGDDTGIQDAQFIMNVLDLNAGDKILDIPCGAGRVAVHLAKAGYQITGIDLNANFISRAKQRFIDESLNEDFHVLDMRNIEYRDQFDVIYSWGGSFGYFPEEENLTLLKKLTTALKPGGHLLIDQPNREKLLRNFVSESTIGKWTSHTQWDASTQRIESTLRIQDEEHLQSFVSMRLYSQAQFKILFDRAGLVWEASYGNTNGQPYEPHSSNRLIFIGKKKV